MKSRTKRCPRCEEVKSLDAFAPDASSADGRYNYCRPCKRAGERERRARPVVRGAAPSSTSHHPAPAPPPAASKPPRGKKMGRPTILTAEVIDQVSATLERGHTRRAAAAVAGVAERSLRQWLANAAEDDASLMERELEAAVELAEGKGEYTLAEIVRNAVEVV